MASRNRVVGLLNAGRVTRANLRIRGMSVK